MMRRATDRQVRGLSRSELGRNHLAAMLETQRGAHGNLRTLIDAGADTPTNLQELGTVEDNIAVLSRALGLQE